MARSLPKTAFLGMESVCPATSQSQFHIGLICQRWSWSPDPLRGRTGCRPYRSLRYRYCLPAPQRRWGLFEASLIRLSPWRPPKSTSGLRGFHYPSSWLDPAPPPYSWKHLERAWRQAGSKTLAWVFTPEYRLATTTKWIAMDVNGFLASP